MKYLVALIIVTVAFACFSAQPCRASESFIRIDTQTLVFLTIPTGARSLAMGRVGVADNSDPLNQFYNPAVLMSAEGVGITQGHLNWLARTEFNDYGVHTGQQIFSNDDMSIRVAGAVRYTEFKQTVPIPATIFLPSGTGRAFDWNDSHVTVTVASGVSTRLVDAGVGFATRRITSKFDNQELDAWAFDVGFIAKFKLETNSGVNVYPSMGISVLNFGQAVDYGSRSSDIPRQVRPGLGLRVEAPSVNFLGRDVSLVAMSAISDYVSEAHGDNHAGYGFETSFVDAVNVRWGSYNNVDQNTTVDSYGIGFEWPLWALTFTFNYAHLKLAALFDGVDAYGTGITYSF